MQAESRRDREGTRTTRDLDRRGIPRAARARGLRGDRMRILIVDNDMDSADALELMLHAIGYLETRVAYSGEAALAIAVDFRPGMVLLDLSLLDMTGYHLAQSLRNRAQSRGVRLIALTSSPEHAGREQARAAGFERYLVKPIASVELFNVMEMSS